MGKYLLNVKLSEATLSKYLHYGSRITAERARLGMSQTGFSELLGISRKTLFNYENGDNVPDISVLDSWKKHGIDTVYILTGEKTFSQLTDEELKIVKIYRNANPQVKALLSQGASAVGDVIIQNIRAESGVKITGKSK